MKKSLKLNALAAQNLSETEMNQVRGGEKCCGCGCAHANNGGSSTMNNGNANYAKGYVSVNSPSQIYKCESDSDWTDSSTAWD